GSLPIVCIHKGILCGLLEGKSQRGELFGFGVHRSLFWCGQFWSLYRIAVRMSSHFNNSSTFIFNSSTGFHTSIWKPGRGPSLARSCTLGNSNPLHRSAYGHVWL